AVPGRVKGLPTRSTSSPLAGRFRALCASRSSTTSKPVVLLYLQRPPSGGRFFFGDLAAATAIRIGSSTRLGMSELETWKRAEQLLSQRRIDVARQQYASLRDSAELGIAARMRLSMISGGLGDFRGAVDEVVDTVASISRPVDPHALSMLFKRLLAVGEHELGL